MPLDEQLQRVHDGDGESLRVVMDEHAPLAYGIALRITGSEADAADIVQEVFIGLPEALAKFDGRNFRGWLTTITKRYAYISLRTDQRRRRAESNVSWSGKPSQEDALLAGLDIEVALAGLDDDLWRVFMLKEVQGLSHDEVAAELDISAGLSRVRLIRARRALMERLDP